MPNPQTLFQLQADAAYQRDGALRGWNALRQWVAEKEHFSDAAEMTVTTPQNGTGAATVVSTQATRLYGVLIDSSGSAGFLVMHNSVASTVGVTAISMVIPFAANQSKVVSIFASDYDTANDFATGITIGTVTAVATSTAIGTAVNKVTLLTDSVP